MRLNHKKLLRRSVVLFLSLGVVLPALGVAPTSFNRLGTKPPAENYVPGEVLVKFKPQLSAQARAQSVSVMGHQLRKDIGNGWAHISHEAGQSVEAAVAAYRADPNVEYAQPNYIYKATAIPNDPSYGQLWGLKNTGQSVSNAAYPTNNPGIAGSDMDMELAWDRITDCSSVIVAVVDSGVNYTHQDLAANMWDGSSAGFPNHGFDFIDNDNDPMPSDADSHGTHVAGTIGARGNNGLGTTGVCWSARIMAVRSLGTNGGTTASVIQGVDFATQRGAKVINMSLGGPSFDQAFSDAINRARNAGLLVVVAAGNSGTNNDGGAPLYPCNFTHDNLICVAALDQAYARASFSNTGSTSVDVGAPGTNTMSTWAGSTLTDDFSGWNLTGWSQALNCAAVTPVIPFMLVNPANWCAGGLYSNNVDHVAYKTFDLSGVLGASFNFAAFIDTEPGFDFFSIASKSTGGDPFAAGGTLLQMGSGSTGGSALGFDFSLAGCRTPACSIGFRLQSDSSVQSRGIGIFNFEINTAQTGSTTYKTISGTSMATPHVSGLAAMILAYNPSYTYIDAANSIKNGGDTVASLVGVTTTGKAVNAMGSLRYINPPSGVSAAVLP